MNNLNHNIMQLLPPHPVHTGAVDVSYHTVNVLMIGRIRCVKDPQGQMLLASLLVCWLYGFCSIYFIVVVPAYDDGLIPSVVTYCEYFILLYIYM